MNKLDLKTLSVAGEGKEESKIAEVSRLPTWENDGGVKNTSGSQLESMLWLDSRLSSWHSLSCWGTVKDIR